jgi:hypothetical protein
VPSKTERELLENATDKPRRGTRTSGGLERITVNLTPRSWRALEQAVEITGDIKTDAINRAIQIYAYLEQVIQAGGSVHVQESADAEMQRLKIVG